MVIDLRAMAGGLEDDLPIKAILEEQTVIEWLPIDEIRFDKEYQRELSHNKVRLIAENFNEAAAGVLIVNQRTGGSYYGMDGQHRLAAMKKVGKLLVQCKVCRGLTQAQEAKIFIYCNTVRKTPDALDTFKARLLARDPAALAINATVERCGLTIQFVYSTGSHGKRRSPQSVWAVTAMEDIYKRGGDQLLSDVLTLVNRAWPEEGDAKKAYVLLGVMGFHLKYKGRYSRDDFVEKMHVTDFRSLARRAQYHAESGGGSIHTAFAKALQEAYDKSRRTRRLEKGEV